MYASLRFLSASEREPQSQAELPSALAQGSSSAASLASILRRAEDASRSRGPRRACRLPPAVRPRSSGRPEREDKGRTGRPASRARTHGAHPARTRRAPARLPTYNRHVFRSATRASHGALNGASPDAQSGASHGAQNGASLDAQSGVSLGTQTARLPTCRAACLPARERRVYRRAN